jgi:hypothetical protein
MKRVLVFLLALALTAATFIFDNWTPQLFAQGLLYLLPVLLLRNEPGALQGGMALLAVSAITMGYFNSPPTGFMDPYIILNRALSALVILVVVVLQIDRRAAAVRLNPQDAA